MRLTQTDGMDTVGIKTTRVLISANNNLLALMAALATQMG